MPRSNCLAGKSEAPTFACLTVAQRRLPRLRSPRDMRPSASPMPGRVNDQLAGGVKRGTGVLLLAWFYCETRVCAEPLRVSVIGDMNGIRSI